MDLLLTNVFRFVRLGVPTIQLDAQGRARPSICSLYNWRYRNLGNLPHVLNHPDYKVSKSGERTFVYRPFVHDWHCIDSCKVDRPFFSLYFSFTLF